MTSKLSLSVCCYNSNRNWPRLYSKQNIQEFVQELAPVLRILFEGYFNSLILWRLITTVDWERSTAYRSDVYPCKVLEGFTCAVWLHRCLTRSILANMRVRDIPPLTHWYTYSRQCMKQQIRKIVVLGSFLLITQMVLIWLIIAFLGIF